MLVTQFLKTQSNLVTQLTLKTQSMLVTQIIKVALYDIEAIFKDAIKFSNAVDVRIEIFQALLGMH
jgi:hypothetical protein